MFETRSAGGVVLGDDYTIALVLSQNSDTWLFPKGHIEPGETDEEAARREIAEETGLTELEYLDDLGEFTRSRFQRNPEDSASEIKTIHMFLYTTRPGATLAPTLEIREARWVPFREVPDTLGSGTNEAWFTADRAWYAGVAERVRQAFQRD